MSGYRSTMVAVRGGPMSVGIWGPDDADAPTVLAVHGITANHRSWPLVAEGLPDVRVIAVDLRGRGRSNGLPAPFGMRQHAEDLLAVLDHLGIPIATVVGHSMGAFVSVMLAALAPARVGALVLVDGGLPLRRPEGFDSAATPVALLGPAARRLSMVFATGADYRAFWSEHPAFAASWSPTVEDYVDYDLTGVEPELRAATPLAAVLEDSAELYGETWYLDALRGLTMPVAMLRAPRGLLDEPAALYTAAEAANGALLVPGLRVREVADVNHYTILLGDGGAREVARAVRASIAETGSATRAASKETRA